MKYFIGESFTKLLWPLVVVYTFFGRYIFSPSYNVFKMVGIMFGIVMFSILIVMVTKPLFAFLYNYIFNPGHRHKFQERRRYSKNDYKQLILFILPYALFFMGAELIGDLDFSGVMGIFMIMIAIFMISIWFFSITNEQN